MPKKTSLRPFNITTKLPNSLHQILCKYNLSCLSCKKCVGKNLDIDFLEFNFFFLSLPYFGLGQLYINRGDTENAAQCFERVLKAQPGNYETMRILGALYANSDNEAKREIAKSHLKKVTDQFSDDVEAWMELSQILVQSDLQASLNSNITATKIFTEKMQVDFVPPQLYNNRGSLLFQVGDPREAKNYFEEALKSVEKAQAEDPDDEDYYKEISYTIRYNIGLMEEALCQYDKVKK